MANKELKSRQREEQYAVEAKQGELWPYIRKKTDKEKDSKCRSQNRSIGGRKTVKYYQIRQYLPVKRRSKNQKLTWLENGVDLDRSDESRPGVVLTVLTTQETRQASQITGRRDNTDERHWRRERHWWRQHSRRPWRSASYGYDTGGRREVEEEGKGRNLLQLHSKRSGRNIGTNLRHKARGTKTRQCRKLTLLAPHE